MLSASRDVERPSVRSTFSGVYATRRNCESEVRKAFVSFTAPPSLNCANRSRRSAKASRRPPSPRSVGQPRVPAHVATAQTKPTLHVPQRYRRAVRNRQLRRAVVEVHRHHGLAVANQHLHALPLVQVKDRNVVAVGGGKQPPVFGECDDAVLRGARPEPAGRGLQDDVAARGPEVPEADLAVRARRDQEGGVGVERDAQAVGVGGPEQPEGEAAVGGPEPGGAVGLAGGEVVPVGRVAQIHDGAVAPPVDAARGLGPHEPQPDLAVHPARKQHLPALPELQALHRPVVPAEDALAGSPRVLLRVAGARGRDGALVLHQPRHGGAARALRDAAHRDALAQHRRDVLHGVGALRRDQVPEQNAPVVQPQRREPAVEGRQRAARAPQDVLERVAQHHRAPLRHPALALRVEEPAQRLVVVRALLGQRHQPVRLLQEGLLPRDGLHHAAFQLALRLVRHQLPREPQRHVRRLRLGQHVRLLRLVHLQLVVEVPNVQPVEGPLELVHRGRVDAVLCDEVPPEQVPLAVVEGLPVEELHPLLDHVVHQRPLVVVHPARDQAHGPLRKHHVVLLLMEHPLPYQRRVGQLVGEEKVQHLLDEVAELVLEDHCEFLQEPPACASPYA
ncbi:acyl- dehydrogenase domain-containing protein, putative [Babesia caballi]|uniref:Acyl- dehydrogenase domain-containing protein, putative n=1 Tax=Babesia caballi TaxID=5871 RepID=A0AAV4LP46_BABCB|nr:acyl- dehydrogenase domain-containing protein, putative [Babesia caballi]